jgi:hypothetical protein
MRQRKTGKRAKRGLVRSTRHDVGLKQYRKVDGKWKWVPVAEHNRNPDPHLVRINGELVPSHGGVSYPTYVDSTGHRIHQKVGSSPAEAMDAWTLRMRIKSGKSDPSLAPQSRHELEEGKGKTIDQAITDYLQEVKATKGTRTRKQYKHDLRWFQSVCQKKYVADLDRSDAIAAFAAGCDTMLDVQPLNQKTINRRVIIMLHAMCNQGATITMVKGDWPKTIDKKTEKYEPEKLKAFFAACEQRNRVLFQVFLCTGFRDHEVSFLLWRDIDWKAFTISVPAKKVRFHAQIL